ncbi:hypothetical protein T06_5057 [Trichinella sp. T6]|nr:hypothetical protein T06_5057 [Trichinella sp. T6]
MFFTNYTQTVRKKKKKKKIKLDWFGEIFDEAFFLRRDFVEQMILCRVDVEFPFRDFTYYYVTFYKK